MHHIAPLLVSLIIIGCAPIPQPVRDEDVPVQSSSSSETTRESSSSAVRMRSSSLSSPVATEKTFVHPLDRPGERVSKKPFGIFITPENSPVSPERFRGYHAGTDYEILGGEEEIDVTVHAICDGSVLLRKDINGYGGVLVQSCTHNDEPITVLYGHLAIASIPFSVNDDLSAGDAIGRLGNGYSSETDGERQHLHLSVHRGSTIELRGYVQDESELTQWIDPQDVIE